MSELNQRKMGCWQALRPIRSQLAEPSCFASTIRTDAAEGCSLLSQDGDEACPILQQYAEKIAMKSHPLSHNERNLMKMEQIIASAYPLRDLNDMKMNEIIRFHLLS